MSNITSAGATPSARISAVVETFACIATLIATIAASAVIQPPTINDLKPTMNMWQPSFGSIVSDGDDVRWPKWACRRAPKKEGGTARTLAGSVRYNRNNYTGIGDIPYLSCAATAGLNRPY